MKGACKHNCCIGWEIDIDERTLAYYNTVSGAMGDRLRTHIAQDDPPHFLLTANERCPFLNRDNLCEVILTLGEAHLCDICAEHPRFRNELLDRTEVGLGLCCEAAARLILSQRAPVAFEAHGTSSVEDSIIALRNEVLTLLQNRAQRIAQRTEAVLHRVGTVLLDDYDLWVNELLALERLDDEWTRLLLFLQAHYRHADLNGFDAFMQDRQTEYEQLAVYFVYRHMANAPDHTQAAARATFAVWAVRLLHRLGAVIWTESGQFSFEQQVELARLFSSEIEYSDENLYILLDLFA